MAAKKGAGKESISEATMRGYRKIKNWCYSTGKHNQPKSKKSMTVTLANQGCELAGKHHEIDLTDIRRAAPEN